MMSANGISTLSTKELRQKAKLDLVALKRQGNVLNSDGTVYSTPLGSAEFNGDNYLATTGGAGTAMGTGDFTWECWVRPTTSSGYQTFIDTRGIQTGYSGSGTDGAYFGLDTDTLFPVYYQDTALLVSSIAVTQDAWTHVALVRSSGTTTLYVGGVSGGTYSDSSNLTGQYVNIGATFFDPGLGLTGQISNLRIVKGTAVYTADFTPPTRTLTAVAGTQLLLLNGTTGFVDGSNNQFTITSENGDVTLSTTVPTLTISTPAYRTRAYYDITQLPTQFDDNTVVDNSNTGGLKDGRPWSLTPPYSAGLYRSQYAGWPNQNTFNPTWFDGKTAAATTVSTDFSLTLTAGETSRGYQWLGYIKPDFTGTWTFTTSGVNVDDCLTVWIGAAAQSGYTTGNAVLNVSTTSGSGTISLTSGTYYPIRVQYANNSGPGTNHLRWGRNGSTPSTDFSSLVYYNSATNGF